MLQHCRKWICSHTEAEQIHYLQHRVLFQIQGNEKVQKPSDLSIIMYNCQNPFELTYDDESESSIQRRGHWLWNNLCGVELITVYNEILNNTMPCYSINNFICREGKRHSIKLPQYFPYHIIWRMLLEKQ